MPSNTFPSNFLIQRRMKISQYNKVEKGRGKKVVQVGHSKKELENFEKLEKASGREMMGRGGKIFLIFY
jgi:hypothetical protein